MLLNMQEEFLFELLSASLIWIIENYKLISDSLSDFEALKLSNDLLKELPSLWDKALDEKRNSIESLKKAFVF